LLLIACCSSIAHVFLEPLDFLLNDVFVAAVCRELLFLLCCIIAVIAPMNFDWTSQWYHWCLMHRSEVW